MIAGHSHAGVAPLFWGSAALALVQELIARGLSRHRRASRGMSLLRRHIKVYQFAPEAFCFYGSVEDAGTHPDGAYNLRRRAQHQPDIAADQKSKQGRQQIGHRLFIGLEPVARDR